jgi:hypothetical protein
MNTRVSAGLTAKSQGHALESALVSKLGNRFVLVNGGDKTDLKSIDNKLQISLKNSDLAHTQVALIGQSTLANFLQLDKDGISFVKLFFGFSDGSKLNQSKLNPYGIGIETLDASSEILRNRVLFNNIPISYSSNFVAALNKDSNKDFFYKKLVAGDANILAWTLIKNDVNSVRYVYMSDVLTLLKKGKWSVSSGNSTIELLHNNQRIMYVQMKGSSARFSSGYHSCMFHLYGSILDKLSIFTDINKMFC